MTNCKICDCKVKNYRYCSLCFKFFLKRDEKFDITNHNFAQGGGEYKDESSHQKGKESEMAFVEILQRNSIEFRPASKKEDCLNHFDFIVNLNDILDDIEEIYHPKTVYAGEFSFSKIEVKSIKSKRRKGKPDPSIIYLEIKNINGGPGWIYGDSDYIAFEQPSHFIFVPTKELQLLVKDLLDSNTMTLAKKSGNINTLYSRRERDDLMMILGISSLDNIENKFCLPKTELLNNNSDSMEHKILAAEKITSVMEDNLEESSPNSVLYSNIVRFGLTKPCKICTTVR